MPPHTLKDRKDVLVLISSEQVDLQKEISNQLSDLGVAYLLVQEYVFSKRIDEILNCVKLFEDDESAEIYTEIIESYLKSQYPSKKIFSSVQYSILPQFLGETPDEVFVDCGAYVGDTIEEYISLRNGVFGKIFAFEPDNTNYQAMEERVELLNKKWALTPDKIKLVEAGVGSRTTVGTFNKHDSFNTSISEQTNSIRDEIKIYALDDFFADQRIDFLKADIESSEWNMLHGAEKVIRRDLPKIAVCIYHNPSDLYRILLWINDLNLGYKFSVRHHSIGYPDTVLYAYD